MLAQEAIDLAAVGNGGLRSRPGHRKGGGGVGEVDGPGQGASLGQADGQGAVEGVSGGGGVGRA